MDKQSKLLEQLNRVFNKIPFNELLGLKVETIDDDRFVARFDMKPELIGNSFQKILHGGVTASVLDSVGGATGMVAAYQRMKDLPEAERMERLLRLGTIDMRIDYLKPGRGEWFLGEGSVLRIGNKVVVTRTSLTNDEGVEIAVGTGTYLY